MEEYFKLLDGRGSGKKGSMAKQKVSILSPNNINRTYPTQIKNEVNIEKLYKKVCMRN